MIVLDYMWKYPKPLEGKPATISRKSVTAKANASGLAVCGKETRGRIFWMDVSGEEASLRWINSFLEETAYHLMNQQPIC